MRYIANPVEADAWVIATVTADISCPNIAFLKLDDGTKVNADEGMTARYWPKPGDYFVKQEDGYCYVNPKSVFERKYRAKPVLVEAAIEAKSLSLPENS